MEEKDLEFIKHLLIHDEGLRLFPYVDCCPNKKWYECKCGDKRGKLTIGVGRNLDDVGITESEAMHLLNNSINETHVNVERNFGSWFNKLNSARKIVVISMAYNMGIEGLRGFQKMIKSITSGDFMSAGNHMMLSKWAGQVGK